MSSIERTMAHLKNKDELHRFVDGLPETAQGIIIVDYRDEERTLLYQEIGDATVMQAVYWLRSLEHFLLSGG